jgi:hypothetical protein
MMPLYLYALVDRRPRGPLGRGIARQPLSLVHAGKAWVVVEPAEAREPTPAALVAHDRVVRRLARSAAAILPLRFASTADDAAAVRALVAPMSALVVSAFRRVREAVQFTLRVSPSASARAPAPSRNAGPGTRWLAKRIAERRVPEIAPLTEATAPYVREARLERRGNAATVYHLVPREHVAAWRAAARRSLAALDTRVRVSVTGPWPPYAFAELA